MSCYNIAIANGELEVLRPRRTDNLCNKCQETPKMKWGSYCRACATELERERLRKDGGRINKRRRELLTPERRRMYGVTRYGLSWDQYQDMLTAQGGKCTICSQVMASPHIDHDHSCCPTRLKCCGKCVRGLLCGNCNSALGLFKDDMTRLAQAARYLEGATV